MTHRKTTLLIALAIAVAAALVGCATQPAAENPPLVSITPPTTVSPEPPTTAAEKEPEAEKVYRYHRFTEPFGDWYSNYPSQSVRWDAGGGFSLRHDDRILFYNRDNEIIKAFQPMDRQWSDAPWEAAEMENWDMGGIAISSYLWNDTYVLMRFNYLGSNGMVIAQKDGQPTIADAVIFDMDGKQVKSFPSIYAPGVTRRGFSDEYEWAIANRTHCYWLDNDILAINTGEAVWLYSVSRDKLKLAADYTVSLLTGWRKGDSYSYGVSQEQRWVEDGKLYYTVRHDVQGVPEKEYGVGYSLWSVGWDSPAICLSGDKLYHEYLVQNGMLFAANRYLENVGADTMWVAHIEQLDEKTGASIAIGPGGELLDITVRQDWFVYATYSRAQQHEQLQYIFHCRNVRTGEEQTWDVPMPEAVGSHFAVLLDFVPLPNGLRFYYYVEDISETDNIVTLVTYDTATGQVLYTPMDGMVEIAPDENMPTRFLETASYARVRLRPLPPMPGVDS